MSTPDVIMKPTWTEGKINKGKRLEVAEKGNIVMLLLSKDRRET